MSVSIDPLSRLVVNEAAVDRELLAKVLENKIRLDLTQGSFAFHPGVRDRLNSRHQVLIALLAQKALHLLNNDYPEGLRPQEIEMATGVKGGTLRPILRVLSVRRLVRQDAWKSYVVPAYAIEDVGRFLNERGD
jgi:hypothetical protein